MNEQTLGQRIATERKKLGLSQEALGEKMGVSRQAISKWESDGAVPEIDKLIAMSKLFGVSLGWLLGVEEADSSRNAALSDEQIKLIRRMIPKPPKPRRTPWIIAMALSAAALVAALLPGRQTAAPDYSQQIANLQSQCQYLQESIQTLTQRMETLTREDAEVLLLDHTIRFDGIYNDETLSYSVARILFSAVPKEWIPGQTAALSILRNGAVVAEVPCTMDSALCTATVDLPLEDGYEYRFVLTNPDGSQTFHLLDDGGCGDLKSGCLVSAESLIIPIASYRQGVLEFEDFSITFSVPHLMAEARTFQWEKLEYYVTVNGSMVWSESLFDSGVMDEADRYEATLTNHYLSLRAETPLENGDTVMLYFEATLDDGNSTAFNFGYWIYGNGVLAYCGQVEGH